MPQLLESTRNYLRSSTKIGRRLSSYRDDSSASEASLHDLAPANLENIKPQQHRRPSTQKRLSALFTLEGRNRNSVSIEDRAAVSMLSSKVLSEETALEHPLERRSEDAGNDRKKRKSNSSRKSTLSQHSLPTPSPQQRSSRLYEPENSSALAENGKPVPRDRSSTFSVARSARTAASSSAASSYDARPCDYPSMKHYQAHLWRRTLLEESIMHSLKLGYATPSPASSPRSSTVADRSGSRSRSKSGSTADRNSRLSKDLPARPTTSDSATSLEVIVDRSMPMPSSKSHQRSLKEEKRISNSPYQLLLNPSTTNITQSYASFTLELTEHQASHVMASSAVPNLFQIKAQVPRGRKLSNPARMMNAGHSGPSPRVLTGKAAAGQEEDLKENMDPRHTHQAIAAAV
ncbi:hypothetical protein BGZ70_008824 [Mortierella alpina]|uniref:Uncharacterized protein n=1 Tax=Mortierella alpina TaxID=64518 RepID=A0A9P6M148_MORAP|nr:hypothetical protein BGZ70_008824 [Mortierella alpina]